MRINKFLKDRLTRCVFKDTDCIKYDWRFGQTANPEELRWWFKNRPCKECAFGFTVFKGTEIPTWEYSIPQGEIGTMDHRPVILKPHAVRERLGYFDVFYQFVVPVGGAGLYTDDPSHALSVSFPFDPIAKPWEIHKNEISGFADRQTLIYFAKYFMECLHGDLRENVVMLCQHILDLGGDVDCLFNDQS